MKGSMFMPTKSTLSFSKFFEDERDIGVDGFPVTEEAIVEKGFGFFVHFGKEKGGRRRKKQ